jgi:hypothetical protein
MNAKSESSRYRPQKGWISVSSSHSRTIRVSSPGGRFERETAKTILALSINLTSFDQSPTSRIGCTGFVTSPLFWFLRCFIIPYFLTGYTGAYLHSASWMLFARASNRRGQKGLHQNGAETPSSFFDSSVDSCYQTWAETAGALPVLMAKDP